MLFELVIVIFYLLIVFWSVRRYQWLYLCYQNGVPGPKPNFLFGHFFQTMGREVPVYKEWIKKFGKTFAIFKNGPDIVTADAELIHKILVRDFKNFPYRRRLFKKGHLDANPEYECGLVANDISIDRWKEQRSLITTAFTSTKIKSYSKMVNAAIDDLMKCIGSARHEPDFNIYALFELYSMETIGRSAFGVELNCISNPKNEFFLMTKKTFEWSTSKWYTIPTLFSFLFPEFESPLFYVRSFIRKFLQLIGRPTQYTYVLETCKKIIKQRREMQYTDNKSKPDDLLQRMIDASMTSEQMDKMKVDQLAAKDTADVEDAVESNDPVKVGKIHQMTDKEVAANAVLMFMAGYETSSAFLAFLFHVIVNHQDLQENLRQELMDLSESDSQNYDCLQSLPLLDSFFYETLRYLSPITRFVARQSIAEYKFKNFVIPADVSIEVAIDNLHKDPEYWDDPLTFDAMRFYGENKSKAGLPQFQAFGSGPRNCPGMKFSLMESKLLVSRILRNYRILPGPRTESFHKLKIAYKVISQYPANGIFVKAVPIDPHTCEE